MLMHLYENMNERGEFAGLIWSNIIVKEMVQFHHCILKMMVNHYQLGAYFKDNISVNLSR